MKELIENAHTINIFTHRNVDWDAVGSILAVAWLLQKLGKQVRCFAPCPKPTYLWRVPDIDIISEYFDNQYADLTIFVDFTDFKRIEEFDMSNIWKLLVIDHHSNPENTKATLTYNDPTSPSCCNLIAELRPRPEHIDATIATYLLLWIITDTGRFVYDDNSSRAMKVAAHLVDMWANKKMITDQLSRVSYDEIVFQQIFLGRMKTHHQIIYSYYIHDEYASLQDNQLKQWFDTMKRIDGFDIAVCFGIDDMLNISMRSTHTEHVHKIAQKLWWWWHPRAAGARVTVHDDVQSQMQHIIEDIHMRHTEFMNS